MGAPPAAASGGVHAHYAHLLHPNRKWYNNHRLMLLHWWIFLCLITSYGNGYDGSMMNGLQSLTQWRDFFHHPQGSRLGLLNAIQNIGSVAAWPFAPYISDGIGRRKTILIGATIMLAATVVQSASQSIGMFIGSRFLVGLGLGIAGNSAPMLITELSYPTYRAQLTALYNSLYQCGAIAAAWSTFGTFKIASSWSWRIPSAIQALPPVLQVLMMWFAPESPRWLIHKGRDEQALETLAYYHADGDRQDPLVQYEYEEIKAAIAFDRDVAANVGYKSLFTNPGNRRRMRIVLGIGFFSQWSGNGLVSYYLNKVFDAIGITNPTTQLLINGLLQIWNFFWAAGASFMVERVGRRPLFLISTAGMFFAFLFQTVCSAMFALHGTQAAAHAVIAFIFLFYGFYDIAYAPLIVSYTVEILPYQLRAKGLNVFGIAVSLSLIFNQYLNPIALKALQWKYYIVYVVWIVFEFVYVYLYVVETKGRTLEETAALFDGDQAVQQVAAQGEHAAGRVEDVKNDDVSDEKRSIQGHETNIV